MLEVIDLFSVGLREVLKFIIKLLLTGVLGFINAGLMLMALIVWDMGYADIAGTIWDRIWKKAE